MEYNSNNPINYSNLGVYKSHPAPHFGTGIIAPYFSATPFRSDFERGAVPTNLVFQTECCDQYDVIGQSNMYGYINTKMIRQKK
jgi:hypothetical protein